MLPLQTPPQFHLRLHPTSRYAGLMLRLASCLAMPGDPSDCRLTEESWWFIELEHSIALGELHEAEAGCVAAGEEAAPGSVLGALRAALEARGAGAP